MSEQSSEQSSEPSSEQSSEQPSERGEPDGPLSVPDDELPEDLRPSEDNPLAQPAGDDVPDDVLEQSSGRSSEDSQDAQDSDDSDDSRSSADESASESGSTDDDR